MKKVLCFILVAVTGVLSATAADPFERWCLKARTNVYGGYNFAEKQPLCGGNLVLDCEFIRVKFDVGWSRLDTYLPKPQKDICYFSPSLGVALGNKVRCYFLGGWTTWGYIATTDVTECNTDRFFADLFHWKIQTGADIMVSKHLYVNVEVDYMFPKGEERGYVHYGNTSLRTGIGYRF